MLIKICFDITMFNKNEYFKNSVLETIETIAIMITITNFIFKHIKIRKIFLLSILSTNTFIMREITLTHFYVADM